VYLYIFILWIDNFKPNMMYRPVCVRRKVSAEWIPRKKVILFTCLVQICPSSLRVTHGAPWGGELAYTPKIIVFYFELRYIIYILKLTIFLTYIIDTLIDTKQIFFFLNYKYIDLNNVINACLISNSIIIHNNYSISTAEKKYIIKLSENRLNSKYK